MPYRNLQECVRDLERHGELKRIDYPLDPNLELAAIQRRAFQARSPALLFTRPKGTAFPMLCNLFGTSQRLHFIFRKGLPALKAIFQARADPANILRKPGTLLRTLSGLPLLLPKLESAPDFDSGTKKAPVLECRAKLEQLPHLRSWPRDGGAFITLPLVYSEDPARPGAAFSNLGMYRIQLDGGNYEKNELGMHYQIQRGIGVHHARAISQGKPLPVQIFVGGPPALTVAAVMPLPEGLSELRFAGLLQGRRTRLCKSGGFALPFLSEADFCVSGHILPSATKPEGPFGDHLGYYSLAHEYPVFKVEHVHHRKDAIWPFTTVGRPPQEDTVFGDFIHELTAPLLGQVFAGVREVHAVDAAGVHPLLLALGSERYTAYEARRKPREIFTQALHLLGASQTALAKYLLLCAAEDAPGLSARDIPAYLRHFLERTDLGRDLHFLTQSNNDSLDYTGQALHEGSKLIWLAAGEKIRDLGLEYGALPAMPPGFAKPRLALPGILLLQGPRHNLPPGIQDPAIDELGHSLASWPERKGFPLLLLVDDSDFCARNLANFLWVAFTRSDPATDSYGVNTTIRAKHWACSEPLILDARIKPFHAPPLEEDPLVTARIEALGAPGQPLHGLF